MNQAAFSNIELRSYVKAPQSDAESGVRQDDRSCGTRAFKWIVRHPFLSAFATIGLLGAASAGIYGLTLLAAAAPAATALSARNVINTTTKAPSLTSAAPVATSLSTRKAINATAIGSPTHNTPTNQTSAQNNTTKQVSTSITITKQATTTKAPNTPVERASCCKKPDVNPACSWYIDRTLWQCYTNGKTSISYTESGLPTNRNLDYLPSNKKCTRATGVIYHGLDSRRYELSSMDDFCTKNGWGKAKFDDEQC